MASVEEKLLQQQWLKDAREKAVKVEPSVVVAEKKEEFLEGKALQPEASDKVAEEVKKVSKVKNATK